MLSTSLTVNVRDKAYGAKGDGVTDDTAAIQKAVNDVAGSGGVVMVPDGVYLVDAVAGDGKYGILLASRMTLFLSQDAVLKAIPNAETNYAILMAKDVKDVKVMGGTLAGERTNHLAKTGEWGMGLEISGGLNILVEGVTAKECWGDGFYVAGKSKGVTFINVTADHNRRQGLSIVDVDGMVVKTSTFVNTAGTEPEAGMDIEPDPNDKVNDVLVTGCNFTNNAGDGIQCGVPLDNTGQAFITHVVLEHNFITGNGQKPAGHTVHNGIHISNCDGTQVTNNIITNNTGRGIFTQYKARHTTITGNTITGTAYLNPGGSSSGPNKLDGCGIWMSNRGSGAEDCSGSVCAGNILTKNAGQNIYQSPGAGAKVSANITSNN